MNAPNPPKRTPEEIAEEERLRKQYLDLQAQVQRDSKARLTQLDSFLKNNLERMAYYDRMIAQLDPFIEEVEAGPPAPGDEILLEKLYASRELYQASKAMVEIQCQDYQANQEIIRTGLNAPAPSEVKFVDSTHSKPYLLAKAQVETSAARLLMVEIRDAVMMVQKAMDPEEPVPEDAKLDEERIARIGDAIRKSPEIRPALALVLNHYEEAQKLIKQAKRTLRGVGEYAWEMTYLLGNTSVFYKLRGKMFYLERLGNQLEAYPVLAEMFPRKEEEAPTPFQQSSTPSQSGPLRAPIRSTRPLGQQTKRLMQDGELFNDRG